MVQAAKNLGISIRTLYRICRQLPSGIVEEHFSSRRKAGEADKRAPMHFSVYCNELATEDAAPLLDMLALLYTFAGRGCAERKGRRASSFSNTRVVCKSGGPTTLLGFLQPRSNCIPRVCP